MFFTVSASHFHIILLNHSDNLTCSRNSITQNETKKLSLPFSSKLIDISPKSYYNAKCTISDIRSWKNEQNCG